MFKAFFAVFVQSYRRALQSVGCKYSKLVDLIWCNDERNNALPGEIPIFRFHFSSASTHNLTVDERCTMSLHEALCDTQLMSYFSNILTIKMMASLIYVSQLKPDVSEQSTTTVSTCWDFLSVQNMSFREIQHVSQYLFSFTAIQCNSNRRRRLQENHNWTVPEINGQVHPILKKVWIFLMGIFKAILWFKKKEGIEKHFKIWNFTVMANTFLGGRGDSQGNWTKIIRYKNWCIFFF